MKKGITLQLVGATLLVAAQAYAAERTSEIRPSHLLNMETAGTLGAGQLVLSEFGSSGRLAVGVTDRFETRVDFGFLSQSEDRSRFSVGFSEKVRVWGNDFVGIGTEGQVGSQKAMDGMPSASFTARIPITLNLTPLLVTAVPVYSRGFSPDSVATSGAEFGLGLPLLSSLDAIVEASFMQTDGVSGTGYAGGVVFKPSERISIPLVVANQHVGEQPSLGLVGLYAHIGFQL